MKSIELDLLKATELSLSEGRNPQAWEAGLESLSAILEALPVARHWAGQSAFQFRIAPAAREAMRTEESLHLDKFVGYRFARAALPEDGDERLQAYWLELRRALNEWGLSDSRQAMALVGACREMQDNVIQHSGNPASGMCGFRSAQNEFEFGVADSGLGLLKAFNDANPNDRACDASRLLESAVLHGKSRLSEPGRGTGFNTLLRALKRFDAEIRVRTDDISLNLLPVGAAEYKIHLGQQPKLRGFVVCARLRRAPSH